MRVYLNVFARAAVFSLSHEFLLYYNIIYTVRIKQPSGRTRSCGSPDHFRVRRSVIGIIIIYYYYSYYY